ncbi:MAG: peptidylprolyl isomerase [Armatimonadota bacterium]
MRNRMLMVVMALVILATATSVAFAADGTKPFDMDAALAKYWAMPSSTVMATVNGASITKGDLMKMLWSWSAPNHLQFLVNQKLVFQAAKKAGVSITSAEMKAKIDDLVKKSGAPSLDAILAQSGQTREQFMAMRKLSFLAEKIVAKTINVTDAEYAEYARAQHILIRFSQDETDKTKAEETAKAKADEIYAKAKAGEDFAKLADEYSEDPGNVKDGKKLGGDVGWFTHGRMVPDFEKAAFALKPGEISEPVKVFYGYHIIKLIKLGKDASPAEKQDLKKMIVETKTPMELGVWYQKTLGAAKIVNKIAPPASMQPKPQVAPKPQPRRAAPTVAPKAAPAPQPAPAANGEESPETPPPPPVPAGK